MPQAKGIRIVMYGLLVASAAISLFFGNSLWRAARAGEVPVWQPLAVPLVFTAFVLIYGVDRWLLVRRRNFPPARAMFQFAFALAFLAFLWPQQLTEWRNTNRPSSSSDPVVGLLAHKEPVVRAAACELLAWRGQVDALAAVALRAQSDKSPTVRTACGLAAQRLGAGER